MKDMAKVGRPKQDVTKNKTVSLRMSEEQYNRFKAYSEKLGISMTDAIVESMEKSIKKEK